MLHPGSCYPAVAAFKRTLFIPSLFSHLSKVNISWAFKLAKVKHIEQQVSYMCHSD